MIQLHLTKVTVLAYIVALSIANVTPSSLPINDIKSNESTALKVKPAPIEISGLLSSKLNIVPSFGTVKDSNLKESKDKSPRLEEKSSNVVYSNDTVKQVETQETDYSTISREELLERFGTEPYNPIEDYDDEEEEEEEEEENEDDDEDDEDEDDDENDDDDDDDVQDTDDDDEDEDEGDSDDFEKDEDEDDEEGTTEKLSKESIESSTAVEKNASSGDGKTTTAKP